MVDGGLACVEVARDDDGDVEEEVLAAWLGAAKKEERKLQKRMRGIQLLRHSLLVTGRVANVEERLKLASEAGTLERLQAVMRDLGLVVNCPEVPMPMLDGCMILQSQPIVDDVLALAGLHRRCWS